MPLRRLLFGFTGRIRRTHWWVAHVSVFLAASLIFIVIGVAAVNLASRDKGAGAVLLYAFYGLIACYLAISIALGVKRYHDIDRSGWWILLGFIPLGNLWMLFELGMLAGTEGPNRFGPSSRAVDTEELRRVFS